MGYSLWAREPRWRIVEVLAVVDERIITGEVQERKTFDGVEKVRKKWKRQGKAFVVQGGIVHWIPADKWEETWQATDFIETQNRHEGEGM